MTLAGGGGVCFGFFFVLFFISSNIRRMIGYFEHKKIYILRFFLFNLLAITIRQKALQTQSSTWSYRPCFSIHFFFASKLLKYIVKMAEFI